MVKKYDVLVIGAGLGGLSAAARLAKNGQRVLLLERHHSPGGYASSFVRGRFEFDPSLHALSGVGTERNRGGLYHYLEDLGVAQKVEFLPIPNVYRSVFPDLDITIPTGRENAEDVLISNFPHEAKGIKSFFDKIFATYEEVAMLQKGVAGDYPHVFDYMTKTLGDVLYSDVKDPRARAVIAQLWGYVGLPPSKLSYLIYALVLASYNGLGGVHIKGKSRALSNAFVEVIEEMGGEVRFRCGAKKILTSEGRVRGVITEEDEEIAADYIVCNADIITTCVDLIGLDKIPNSFVEKLRSSEVAVSTFNVYLGLDCPPTELGIKEYETFVNDGYDFDRLFENCFKLEAPVSIIAFTTYNLVDPDFSPPGTSAVALTTLQFADPWYNVKPSQYVEVKNSIADKMIAMAERVAPGLREHIEVMEVATPLTNMRYAANYGGSILGFGYPAKEPILERMSPLGPLKGLYLAGAWARGGGYHPCMESGQTAADWILDEIRK